MNIQTTVVGGLIGLLAFVWSVYGAILPWFSLRPGSSVAPWRSFRWYFVVTLLGALAVALNAAWTGGLAAVSRPEYGGALLLLTVAAVIWCLLFFSVSAVVASFFWKRSTEAGQRGG
jgi:hypothetical protein